MTKVAAWTATASLTDDQSRSPSEVVSQRIVLSSMLVFKKPLQFVWYKRNFILRNLYWSHLIHSRKYYYRTLYI
jgi:hypothetical protein